MYSREGAEGEMGESLFSLFFSLRSSLAALLIVGALGFRSPSRLSRKGRLGVYLKSQVFKIFYERSSMVVRATFLGTFADQPSYLWRLLSFFLFFLTFHHSWCNSLNSACYPAIKTV